MPLVPTKMADAQYSVSGNHWPGGPRDMLKTTSARKFKSCVFEPPTRRVFSINTSSSNTLVLFYEISSQRQHALLRNFFAAANTPFSVNQQERKATPWMGLADICGDLGINSKTPNRILTRRLPDTKCINASPRIRLHASIRLKIRKKKNNKK